MRKTNIITAYTLETLNLLVLLISSGEFRRWYFSARAWQARTRRIGL